MTDQRPQYGELATPEEQRRAAGLPPLEEVVVGPPAPPAQNPVPQGRAASAPAARSHPLDRFATIGLLAYGLVNVVVTALSFLDMPSVMNQTMNILGIEGEFTNFAQGRTWGIVAAIVLIVGWSITAALSVRRLRRGRVTWWVPIVGAVATIIVVTICTSVPMMNDPAFVAYLTSVAKQP